MLLCMYVGGSAGCAASAMADYNDLNSGCKGCPYLVEAQDASQDESYNHPENDLVVGPVDGDDSELPF